MGKTLTKIAIWVGTGGLFLMILGIACFLLYEMVDAIKCGEYLIGLIFFILAIFAVSLGLLILGDII